MEEMIVVKSPLGFIICVVDAVHGIEKLVQTALEKRYKVVVTTMPSCSLHPYKSEMELKVPTVTGDDLNITLEKVPYYSR